MNIISLDYEPSSRRGGQELSLLDVLTGLRSKGHEVELGYVAPGDLLEKYHQAGINTVPLERFIVWNKASLKEYQSFFKSAKVFSNPRESIVYINQLFDAPLAVMLKLMYGCRIVCHLRLPPVHKSLQIKICIPQIDAFIVANQHMRNMHVKDGIPSGKIFVVPNGFWMDTVPDPLKFKPPVFKIAYVGRIDAIKGIHVLIDAAKILKDKNLSFQLDIAGVPMGEGQEEYLNQLKEQVSSFGLGSYVRFIGHIKNPIVHLAQYSVCVFPSIWEEPFGRVIVESLLAETPVIGNDVGSVSEIMNDREKQWVYLSTEELVGKIIALKEDRGSYKIEERKAFVKENYDLNKIIGKVEGVLLTAINRELSQKELH